MLCGVLAVAVGLDLDGGSFGDVGDGDGSVGNDGSAGIGNGAEDGAVDGLRLHGSVGEQEQEQDCTGHQHSASQGQHFFMG